MKEFPQKVKDQLGKELEVTNDKNEVIQKGECIDFRWSDTYFIEGNVKYMGVEFLLRTDKKNKWTKPFPTEVVKEVNLKAIY